ncbi:hypothetical protein BJ166DRAFT_594112 [Pestalotiopsis sp. NC0098]|nr:hypothetical protein BJ166DRAFT_594112 [Pestalotiopsis sp. NC0098]
MIGTHRDQAHFDRAKWRKRVLLPCWIIQVPILVALIGLFSYRLSNTIRDFEENELKGDVPMVEFVWECVNIAFSAASLVINLVQIAKFIAEALTPFAMVFGNAISLTLSMAILALDVTVYVQHDDRNYSAAGIGLDCALLFFTIVPIVYGTIVFRRLVKLDEYHLQHNAKAFGFNSEYDTSYDPKRGSLNDTEALYDPAQPAGTTPRRQSFTLKNPLSSSKAAAATEPAQTSPRPGGLAERRESYNHERDTAFDEYVAQRRASGGSAQGRPDLGLGSEFGGTRSRGNSLGSELGGTRSRGNSLTRPTSWDPTMASLGMVDLATQNMPARGHSLNSVPELLEEEDLGAPSSSSSSGARGHIRTPSEQMWIRGDSGAIERNTSVNSGVSSVTDATAVTAVTGVSSVSSANRNSREQMEEIELRHA